MSKTIVIAEAGVNHNGSISLAKKLVDLASRSGANYIKFQTFKSELVFSKNTPKANYQKKNTINKGSALEMGKKLELTEKQHLLLEKYCKKKKIKYLTTFHDIYSLKTYKKYNLDYIKIGSGDINNFPYLEEVSKMKKKILLSSGISDLNDIKSAMKILLKNNLKKKDITVLHCNTAYPTPLGDANLNILNTLKKKLGVKVGFSDHTEGIIASLIAVSMGASVIEKHFTLNKDLPGPDHKASLSPEELNQLIKSIKLIEILKGKSEKKPTKSELKNKIVVRKSIFSTKKIKKGEKFSNSNIFVKRPATGISPIFFNKILGKKATKNYLPDQLIKEKI